MSVLGKPPQDLLGSDNPKDFVEWYAPFRIVIFIVIGATDPLTSVQEHDLALNCIWPHAVKVILGLSYDNTNLPYENLVSALESYFISKANLRYERYRFRRLRQEVKVMRFVNDFHCVMNEFQCVAKKCDFTTPPVTLSSIKM